MLREKKEKKRKKTNRSRLGIRSPSFSHLARVITVGLSDVGVRPYEACEVIGGGAGKLAVIVRPKDALSDDQSPSF